MVDHKLHFSLQLPLPREAVFRFYADAANLGRITPPELEFAIITPLPIEIRQGTEIEYRLKLFGVPFDWKTVIREWCPPDLFVDEQLAGPYHTWIHRHSFRDGADCSTIIEDEILYRLPVAPLGELAYPLVSAQLHRIFSFRQEMVRAILLQEGRGDH
jgi:ligand-binding SRPBCC domain-containing protein